MSSQYNGLPYLSSCTVVDKHQLVEMELPSTSTRSRCGDRATMQFMQTHGELFDAVVLDVISDIIRTYFKVSTGTYVLRDINSALEDLVTRAPPPFHLKFGDVPLGVDA